LGSLAAIVRIGRKLVGESALLRALAAIVLALAVSPVYADGEFDKGVALYKKQDYRGALSMFSQALASGNSPTVLYYAALCYQQLGDMTHAKSCYKLVCDNFGATPEAKLAAQGLKLLEKAPQSGLPPAATAGAAAAGNAAAGAAKAGTIAGGTKNGTPAPDTQSLPGATAGGDQVDKFLTEYKLSDEEWEHLPEQTKIPFQRATSNHPFVNAIVNGRPMRMMFDTGASICMFDRRTMDAAGIKIDKNAPHTRIGGVAGSTDAQVMMADIELGDFERRVPAVVSESPLGVSLLGQSFFKDFKYDIDVSTGFIQLTKKPRPGMKFHVYESTDVVRIPFQPHGNDMMVQVKINGRPTAMYFDTGAQSISLSYFMAASLGIQVPNDAQQVVSGGIGGRIGGVKFYVDRIELGPIIKTHVPVTLLMGITPPLLGQPFFSDRKFTIDNENHTINFAH